MTLPSLPSSSEEVSAQAQTVISPDAYKGLAAFHKYWGKKPIELLSFLIQQLSSEDDLIFDPFLGSGLVARESLNRSRRFLGTDINPFSTELTSLLVDLPDPSAFAEAYSRIEANIKIAVNDSYVRSDSSVTTHCLWEGEKIVSVWTKGKSGRKRTDNTPDEQDHEQAKRFSPYRSNRLRDLVFYHNRRINTHADLTLSDLFTGRALRNIDLILGAIEEQPRSIRKALKLTLTSSIGQMSNMVFAITDKSKASGRTEPKVAVGSWVIGYWRPETHFEVNVWNCFSLRAKRFIKTLHDVPRVKASMGTLNDVIDSKSNCCLLNESCLDVMERCPSGVASVILTDPPHSDRMPYLELSELWNAVLGYSPDFRKEIVVSNAKERGMTKESFTARMLRVCLESERILKEGGYLVIMHNAKDPTSWNYLNDAIEQFRNLRFLGAIPASYSAGSIVQDSRKGALKSDFVLLFRKGEITNGADPVSSFPGFTRTIPHLKATPSSSWGDSF